MFDFFIHFDIGMPKGPGIFAKLKPWEFSEFKGNPGIVKCLE